MKLIAEKPIDQLYMLELEEIAEWHEEDLEFALKQAISLYHSRITGFKDYMKIKEE